MTTIGKNDWVLEGIKLHSLVSIEEVGVSFYPFSEMFCALGKETCTSEEALGCL